MASGTSCDAIVQDRVSYSACSYLYNVIHHFECSLDYRVCLQVVDVIRSQDRMWKVRYEFCAHTNGRYGDTPAPGIWIVAPDTAKAILLPPAKLKAPHVRYLSSCVRLRRAFVPLQPSSVKFCQYRSTTRELIVQALDLKWLSNGNHFIGRTRHSLSVANLCLSLPLTADSCEPAETTKEHQWQHRTYL